MQKRGVNDGNAYRCYLYDSRLYMNGFMYANWLFNLENVGDEIDSRKIKTIYSAIRRIAIGSPLFLGTLGIQFDWFTEDSIGAFMNVLIAAVPFILVIYGVWKNSYIITKQIRKQAQHLKEKGLIYLAY